MQSRGERRMSRKWRTTKGREILTELGWRAETWDSLSKTVVSPARNRSVRMFPAIATGGTLLASKLIKSPSRQSWNVAVNSPFFWKDEWKKENGYSVIGEFDRHHYIWRLESTAVRFACFNFLFSLSAPRLNPLALFSHSQRLYNSDFCT